jgi:hypothetical protein
MNSLIKLESANHFVANSHTEAVAAIKAALDDFRPLPVAAPFVAIVDVSKWTIATFIPVGREFCAGRSFDPYRSAILSDLARAVFSTMATAERQRPLAGSNGSPPSSAPGHEWRRGMTVRDRQRLSHRQSRI